MSTNRTGETKERTRRPRARHRDVILGAIAEHLIIVKTRYRDEALTPHLERIDELFDELNRSLALDGKDEVGE